MRAVTSMVAEHGASAVFRANVPEKIIDNRPQVYRGIVYIWFLLSSKIGCIKSVNDKWFLS